MDQTVPSNLILQLNSFSGTRFGAMLDMLTDRCSTMCLLVNLALLYPRATLLFQLSMSLDVASHWLHLHRSALKLEVLMGGKYYSGREMGMIQGPWEVSSFFFAS